MCAVGGQVFGSAWIVGIKEGHVDIALGIAGDFIGLIDEMQESVFEVEHIWNRGNLVIGQEQVILGVVEFEFYRFQDIGADQLWVYQIILERDDFVEFGIIGDIVVVIHAMSRACKVHV